MADKSWETDSEPIAGYRLTRRLGVGGFGEVWEAIAPGGLRKAIKFVFGKTFSAVGPDNNARRELEGLAQIRDVRHPFILSIERYEIIDGQLVVVMELADRNLEDRLVECHQQGWAGVPRAELLGYMKEAAEALDLMNGEYGVQHLDVKPANLFLVRNHVKVADFGLAKALEGFSAEVAAGMTPAYAAPETFDGWASRNSDQYSLAIVYQELLTGRRPFAGPSARQFMMQQLTVEPDLSSLPDGDRHVVAQALAKSPSDRFPNCASFVAALAESSGPETTPFDPARANRTLSTRITEQARTRNDSNPSAPAAGTLGTESTQTSLGSPQSKDVLDRAAIPIEARRRIANFRDIGTMPDVAMELANLLFHGDPPTVSQVLEVVSRRPKVADRVLALANHPGLARDWNVRNLPRAVNAFGPNQVCSLLLADAYFGTRQWQIPGFVEPHKTWWQTRSVWTGCLAFSLATGLGDVCPHRAFSLGMLQDVGIAGMLRAFPRRYRLYLIRSQHKPADSLVDMEQKWFGYTHADASAAMATLWGLPSPMIRLILQHHDPAMPNEARASAREEEKLPHVIRAAELWADFLDGNEEDRLPGLVQAAKLLRRPAPLLARRDLVTASEHAKEIATLFSVPMPPPKALERLAYVLTTSLC